MIARRLVALALVGALAAACAGSDDAASTTTTTTTPSSTVPVETGSTRLGPNERPAELVAPDEVTAPAPLLVVLHGYKSTAVETDAYLGTSQQAATRGMYVLLPNGLEERVGRQFWDASPACCNFTGNPVDDVGYLSDLIEEAIATRPIDPDRVYVMGHSNGGFMSYRMACERADLVTAVLVLSGQDPEAGECEPNRPVSVRHVHGTADQVIRYDGGRTVTTYPGAVESVARWAERLGCEDHPIAADPVDLDANLDGAETTVQVYEGCDDGVDVELDTIVDARHVPAFAREQMGDVLLEWLLEHTR